jgi:hypothetical protein
MPMHKHQKYPHYFVTTVPTVKLDGQKDDFWDLYGQDDLFIEV